MVNETLEQLAIVVDATTDGYEVSVRTHDLIWSEILHLLMIGLRALAEEVTKQHLQKLHLPFSQEEWIRFSLEHEVAAVITAYKLDLTYIEQYAKKMKHWKNEYEE